MNVQKAKGKPLSKQKQHWENTYSKYPIMFGGAPSLAVIKASGVLKTEKRKNVLELGGGHGRDTIFLAKNDFKVNVLDYSRKGIEIM